MCTLPLASRLARRAIEQRQASIERAADLVVGLPGLVSLQVLEGGRLKALYSHAREGRARNRP
jgi:hypothetical protein